ncbi:flagellar biosynthetic protein FliO (plasmid) [Rossellomorea sp. AcN35-11]|nr:flagellar biosynthetic protein FliO [Rossellomorea aquimaris]WJV32291.1 flagellar biosynthetic protein FliO [Rossellomorea sp. AcN35-11]
MIRAFLIALVMLLTPMGIAHAESNNNSVWENMNQSSAEKTKPQSEELPNTEIGFGEGIKTFISLIFVIGLILVVFYFIKKRKNNGFSQDNMFENIGGLPLGNQRSLQVVRMNNRIFILGVSDSIQLIKEVEDPEEVRDIIHRQSETAEHHFATKFQQQLDQIKQSPKETISKLLGKDKDDD